MNNISIYLLLQISKYLDISSLLNLTKINKKIYDNSKNILINNKKRKAIKIIINFFNKIKYNFKDLRLNRKGYLINPKRIFKHPEEYINKKIQFISSFQYYHYNLRKGEIGEGILSYHSNTDSWYFTLENDFYNYHQDEPLPTNHLLFDSFIFKKSLRVIK
jgi:hypothetical protein